MESNSGRNGANQPEYGNESVKTGAPASTPIPSRAPGRKPDFNTLTKKLPEWILLEKLCDDLASFGTIHHLGTSFDSEYEFPLMGLSFGSKDPQAPTLGLFGGVHGLERIGAQVVLALLKSFSELILWDKMIQHALSQVRICFFPMVNPIGVLRQSRANPQGVDLMRNAPNHSSEKPTFLVGGQKISNRLPWFRGNIHNSLESESQALLDFCEQMFFQSRAAVTMDFHSGFGIMDRIWLPYAKSTAPFPHLAEAYAFKESFDRTYPNHIYKIEPQAKNYTTDGDLWDYAYDQFYARPKNKDSVYLPLCLEMGSWMWVKKNPLQLFSTLGPFNPLKPHRQKRILRRHIPLFDFLIRSVVSPEAWILKNPEQRAKFQMRALEHWYGKSS